MVHMQINVRNTCVTEEVSLQFFNFGKHEILKSAFGKVEKKGKNDYG